jgi:polysaccharide pyruvyl transferase CsaB
VLVCGWAGAGNVGDELLTRAVVGQLLAAGARVVVASRDPDETEARHPGVDAVPWGARGLRRMGSVHGVCVGPGGILQDSSSLWSLPGHLVMPWRARRRGAAIAAIGVGVEPLRRRSSARWLRTVLADVPVVTRDAESTSALASVGIVSTTGADLVFGLAMPTVERRSEIVVSVGPSVRPGRIAPAARRLEPAPAAPIARALDELAARLDCRIVLTRFRGRRDHEAARSIAARIRADVEILDDDVDAHVRRVAGARLVVSSRYHPIVLAAASRTPALVVSSQAKLMSLVDQIDDPSVRRVTSWDHLGGSTVGPVPSAVCVPSGIEAANRALIELVRHADATRGEDRLG